MAWKKNLVTNNSINFFLGSDKYCLIDKNPLVSYKLENVSDSENFRYSHNSNNINSQENKNIFTKNEENLDGDNIMKSNLFSENELSENISHKNKNFSDELNIQENPNNSPVKNIINNQKLKRMQLLNEKETITSQFSNNVKEDKKFEFNKICLTPDNPDIQRKNKKNSFKFNFLEYFTNTLCCFRKNEKVNIKNILLDNSEDFCEYYLDINTYVKKMIEID